jgi:hypothetical protein
MDMETVKAIGAGMLRHALTGLAGTLAAHGYIQSSQTEQFIGAGLFLAGIAWSWWQKSGQAQVADLLKKLTTKTATQAAATTTAAAVATAKDLPAGSAVTKGLPLILLAVVALSLFASPALAVNCIDPLNKIPIGCTPVAHGSVPATAGGGAATNALAGPFQAIADLIASDSDEAIALATSIPDLQDGNGQQCWLAMRSFGAVLKAHPVPLTLKAQTDMEALRLLTMAANKLCSNTACTQVFADLTNGAQTVTGSPLGIPSLNGLCSKVPQIVVAAPVTVPPAPATPAVPATPAKPNP